MEVIDIPAQVVEDINKSFRKACKEYDIENRVSEVVAKTITAGSTIVI